MPQNGMNLEDRRRWTHHNTWKAKVVLNNQFPDSGSVIGAGVYNGHSAAGSRTRESTPADTQQSPKPPCMVNGYINHGHKDRNTKAASLKSRRKQQGTTSAVIDISAAGRISGAGVPGGISANGDARQDTVAMPHNSGQSQPNSSLVGTGKDQRRRKKFRCKKRTPSPPPPPPPQEEEDWESEIQDITLDNWDKMCFGVKPYGPEDLLHFALRDLTLKQRDTQYLPVTASYSPALHHPRPIKWSCYSVPTESDQFADAD